MPAVVCVVLAVGVVGVGVGIFHGAASRSPEVANVAESGFRLDATAIGVDFRAARRTLILAIQEDCPACAASMPFYRQLTERAE